MAVCAGAVHSFQQQAKSQSARKAKDRQAPEAPATICDRVNKQLRMAPCDSQGLVDVAK
jgi:hypothetical protein